MKEYIFEIMKQTFIILLLLLCRFSYGQIYPTQNDYFKTKLERAVNVNNVLIKKEFVDLNRIEKVNFKFLKVYNFETKTTTKGLYISNEFGWYFNKQYLDSTEIVAFCNWLLIMDTVKYNYNSKNNLIFNLKSNDNFLINATNTIENWVWDYSFYVDCQRTKKKKVHIKYDQFKQLISIFVRAKSML